MVLKKFKTFMATLDEIFINLIQAMIQKARVYPQFEYLPQKYQLDHFHNPYLSKLNVKITPRYSSDAKYRVINPLANTNNLYLSHSLPIYKNQKFRLALIWRHYMTNKFSRSHIGISLEHKVLQQYRIKSQFMSGTTSLINLEFSKVFKNNYQIFLGCSSFFETNHVYNSISCGIKKGLFSLLFTHKMKDETQFKLGGNKQLQDGVNLGLNINGNILQPDRSEVQLSLNQQLNNKASTTLSLGFNPYYRELAVKVQYQHLITKSQKILISGQYNQKGSVLYLGFKNLNFNFVFPFLVIDSPLPLILGAIGFGLAYLYHKKKPKEKNLIDINSDFVKSEAQRQDELKLISEKAAQNYEKERQNAKGLLIQEAYIGPEEEIANFMNNPERFILLLRSQEHKSKFVDLTVSLRFYVCRNQLKIRKGDKSRLLGFYRKDNSHNLIGVRYSREGVSKIKFFHIDDPLMIKKQE